MCLSIRVLAFLKSSGRLDRAHSGGEVCLFRKKESNRSKRRKRRIIEAEERERERERQTDRQKERERERESDRYTRWKFNQLISIHNTCSRLCSSLARSIGASTRSRTTGSIQDNSRIRFERPRGSKRRRKPSWNALHVRLHAESRTGNREESDCWIICSGYFDFASTPTSLLLRLRCFPGTFLFQVFHPNRSAIAWFLFLLLFFFFFLIVWPPLIRVSRVFLNLFLIFSSFFCLFLFSFSIRFRRIPSFTRMYLFIYLFILTCPHLSFSFICFCFA